MCGQAELIEKYLHCLCIRKSNFASPTPCPDRRCKTSPNHDHHHDAYLCAWFNCQTIPSKETETHTSLICHDNCTHLRTPRIAHFWKTRLLTECSFESCGYIPES